jgi:predicted AAA+ superfamily ATPase
MENNYIKRKIDSDLTEWKNSADRMPLLLRGARQVGKSSSVRNLARGFESFVEINFEKNKNAGKAFEGDLIPQTICGNLSYLLGKRIIAGKTLLFFDEIQSCPAAIESLRFFYEDYPELHLIAAGSLLEFALEELNSFGVGRIQSLFMYPFSFMEFLHSLEEDMLIELIKNQPETTPIFEPAHKKLLQYLKIFLITGGMPKVVATYQATSDLLQCGKVLSQLLNSLKTDFAKYKRRVTELRLANAFNSVANQMGKKFVYAKATGNYDTRQIKECIELLRMAGLILPVVHTSANGIPLGAEISEKHIKYLFLDTGLYQNLLGLDLSDLLLSDDFAVVNKGSIAELHVGLELIKSAKNDAFPQLYNWVREAKGSNAEVDYLIQKNNKIIPIEVKAGTKGSMQSLYLFMKEKQSEYGIRASLENFGEFQNEEGNLIKIYPLYSIENIQ